MLLFIILPPVKIVCGQETKQLPAPSAAAQRKKAETRALWVVRTTLVSPEKIRTMVKRAASNNFDTIIVQVRGRGDAYYNSRW